MSISIHLTARREAIIIATSSAFFGVVLPTFIFEIFHNSRPLVNIIWSTVFGVAWPLLFHLTENRSLSVFITFPIWALFITWGVYRIWRFARQRLSVTGMTILRMGFILSLLINVSSATLLEGPLRVLPTFARFVALIG